MKGTNFLRGERARLLEDLIFRATVGARKEGFEPVVMPLVINFRPSPWCFDVVKGGKNYGCLRPEGTAQYIKFLPEGKNFNHYYWGPMFRSERSQAFRRREFYQFCLESTRKYLSPGEELICIKLLLDILKDFFKKEEIEIKMNSLGSIKEKESFISDLQGELNLSETEISHLLDKEKISHDIYRKLSKESLKEFLMLLRSTKKMGYTCTWSPSLFRGLHYYNNWIFEVKCRGITVAGGGRYDGLWGKFNPKKKGYYHFGLGIGLTRIVELLT